MKKILRVVDFMLTNILPITILAVIVVAGIGFGLYGIGAVLYLSFKEHPVLTLKWIGGILAVVLVFIYWEKETLIGLIDISWCIFNSGESQ